MWKSAVAVIVIAACGSGEADRPPRPREKRPPERHLGVRELEAVTTAAKDYYVAHHAYPSITTGQTPAQPCCEFDDHACPPSATDWRKTDWIELGFRMDAPTYFQLGFHGEPREFTATATADLDCDPVSGQTILVAHGRVVDGAPFVDIEVTSEEQ